ncbi:unnamed protein product [Meganyctiphanes norvegica]|uniref:Uncharacterized protein n=1 Tax=Meganyctiphanes norvegica TaxID=48144 RepID=A0AAV2SML8_MEGNR
MDGTGSEIKTSSREILSNKTTISLDKLNNEIISLKKEENGDLLYKENGEGVNNSEVMQENMKTQKKKNLIISPAQHNKNVEANEGLFRYAKPYAMTLTEYADIKDVGHYKEGSESIDSIEVSYEKLKEMTPNEYNEFEYDDNYKEDSEAMNIHKISNENSQARRLTGPEHIKDTVNFGEVCETMNPNEIPNENLQAMTLTEYEDIREAENYKEDSEAIQSNEISNEKSQAMSLTGPDDINDTDHFGEDSETLNPNEISNERSLYPEQQKYQLKDRDDNECGCNSTPLHFYWLFPVFIAWVILVNFI